MKRNIRQLEIQDLYIKIRRFTIASYLLNKNVSKIESNSFIGKVLLKKKKTKIINLAVEQKIAMVEISYALWSKVDITLFLYLSNTLLCKV